MRLCYVVFVFAVDLEADISQLEAPTFTTINRGPPEPMLRLDWSHKVNLMGEKVLNPMIHCCDKCLKPILIYGRMVIFIVKITVQIKNGAIPVSFCDIISW